MKAKPMLKVWMGGVDWSNKLAKAANLSAPLAGGRIIWKQAIVKFCKELNSMPTFRVGGTRKEDTLDHLRRMIKSIRTWISTHLQLEPG